MNKHPYGHLLAAILVVAIGCFATAPTRAALMIPDVNATYTIDFDNDLPGVNNGPYAGTGFTPAPASGQLDSTAWAATSFEPAEGGDLNFGDTNTRAAYTRGESAGEILFFGLYSFDVSNGGTLDRAFGIQPIGGNWTPGTLTLRLQNASGQELTELELSYEIHVRNNGNRANTFNFSHSDDNSTYVPLAALDFVSPQDGSPGNPWVLTPRGTILSGLSILPGEYYYLRWSGDSVSGLSTHDEFALDDITISNIVANVPEPSAMALAGLAVVPFAFVFVRANRKRNHSSLGGPS